MRLTHRPRSRGLLAALPLVLLWTTSSACGLNFSTGIEAKEAWTRTYTVNDGAEIELREPNGRILVEATASNVVEVNATRVAKGPNEEAAKAALADVKIKESVTADRVALESNSDSGMSFRIQRRVDYDVKMPKNGKLTIKNTNGQIIVRSVAGFVKIESVNGEIEVSGAEKGADVSAINGQVKIEMTSVGDGGVRAKTTNGQIIVTVPTTAKATIAARVLNGVVHTENLTVQSSDSSHRKLDGTIGGGGPEIRLDTTNGEIKIRGRE